MARKQEPWLNLIYLSGPIGSTNGAGHTWREEVAAVLLKEFSIGTFSPAGAFKVNDSEGNDDPVSRAVLEINRCAIHWSDAVFCVLPPGKQSIGSIREVEMARAGNKPVVLVTEGHRPHFGVDLEIVPDRSTAYQVLRGWRQMSWEDAVRPYRSWLSDRVRL